MQFFFLDTLKTTFRMANLTQGWTKSGHFFSQNQGTFFDFYKGAGGASPPSCMPDWRKPFAFSNQKNETIFHKWSLVTFKELKKLLLGSLRKRKP